MIYDTNYNMIYDTNYILFSRLQAHGKLSAREAEVQRLTDTSSALEHQLIRLQALEPTLLQLQTQHAALQDEYTRCVTMCRVCGGET